MHIAPNKLVRAIPEIEQLNVILKRFSPFKILKVEDAEIRHSNVLAWLLNPNESHGFGDRVFKDLISKILTSSENEGRENIGDYFNALMLSNYSDLNIDREVNNIDILCISESNKFILLIENKMRSGEHSDQLKRYLGTIKDQYSKHIVLPVLLSIEGLSPSLLDYFAASYQQVNDVIRHLLEIHSEKIANNVREFINQYIAMIEEKTMTDPKLQKIAMKIYRENKLAIDFIYSIGNSIDLTSTSGDFLKKYPDLVSIVQNPSWFQFVSKGMDTKIKSQNSWGDGNPAIFWFAPYNEKLKLCLEVGPLDNGKTRLEFLLHLERNGIKLRPSSKTESGTYTRLWTNVVQIKDWQDGQELLDKMIVLFENKELKCAHAKLVKTISEFQYFWSDVK